MFNLKAIISNFLSIALLPFSDELFFADILILKKTLATKINIYIYIYSNTLSHMFTLKLMSLLSCFTKFL